VGGVCVEFFRRKLKLYNSLSSHLKNVEFFRRKLKFYNSSSSHLKNVEFFRRKLKLYNSSSSHLKNVQFFRRKLKLFILQQNFCSVLCGNNCLTILCCMKVNSVQYVDLFFSLL
jgi:hypothetical protein